MKWEKLACYLKSPSLIRQQHYLTLNSDNIPELTELLTTQTKQPLLQIVAASTLVGWGFGVRLKGAKDAANAINNVTDWLIIFSQSRHLMLAERRATLCIDTVLATWRSVRQRRHPMAAKEIFPGITSDPKTWSGKSMLKGRRIPASLVIAMLAGGMSLEDLEEEYDLSVAEVRTALDYAATKLEALEEQEAAQRAEVAEVQHP